MTSAEAARILKVVGEDEAVKDSGPVPGQVGAAVVEERDDEFDLSPLERRFAEEYFGGDHAHNGTRSYMAASPSANYNTASIEAGIFLKRPRVQNYLRELHRRATEAFTTELRVWSEFLPLCQRILVATAEGRLKNRLAFDAAVYLTNRVLGMPTATVDLVVMNRERIATATKVFAARLRQEHRKRLSPGNEPESRQT